MALTGTKDMTTWEMLELVVKQWHRLEKTIKEHGDGPWWASWTAGGIARQV